MHKVLIVNADDLGYDPEIDRGILEAHARGIVTSTSAMVDTEGAPTALAGAPRTLGVGLHLVLDPGLDAGAALTEVTRQIDRFQELRGAPPTHLDGHKHVHARPAILAAVARVAAARRLPVRSLGDAMRRTLAASGVRSADHFLGNGDLRPCWTPERLKNTLAQLLDGVTELMAHPGYRPARAKTSFGVEREAELAALCDPALRPLLVASDVRLADWTVFRE